MLRFALSVVAMFVLCFQSIADVAGGDDETTVRVFIFAGQSNMVGSDSKIEEIDRFPPFTGLDNPQTSVRFSYCLGREDKLVSEGWEPLRPVYNVVGPELSFARELTRRPALTQSAATLIFADAHAHRQPSLISRRP